MTLTAAKDDPRLLDRLREHTEGVVDGPLRLVQDLLCGASQHDGTRLTQLHT